MTKRYCIFITALFCAFIGVFLVANAVSPDRTFSEVENRNLEQLPAVDFGTPEKLFRDGNFFNGQFMRDFETYTTDQFIGRDAWVDLKARTERALGKKENNDVYFADNDTLITRFDQPAADRVTENLNYVNKFVENVDIPVVFSLIPTQACIWADRLPEGAPNASQTDLMAQAQGAVKPGGGGEGGPVRRASAGELQGQVPLREQLLVGQYGPTQGEHRPQGRRPREEQGQPDPPGPGLCHAHQQGQRQQARQHGGGVQRADGPRLPRNTDGRQQEQGRRRQDQDQPRPPRRGGQLLPAGELLRRQGQVSCPRHISPPPPARGPASR